MDFSEIYGNVALLLLVLGITISSDLGLEKHVSVMFDLASVGSIRFVVFNDPSTPSLHRHLYMLSLHLVLTIVTPCWLGHLDLLPIGFSMCWMLQHKSSLACESLTAACLICSTLSYIGWTSIPSTWWTAACVRLTFSVVSTCGQPFGVSWSCHDTVTGSLDVDHSLLQLQWSGTHFWTLFGTQRWASTTSDRH